MGVAAPPGKREAGDVSAATDGSFVPPGVSAPPPAKECSNGFGSNERCEGAVACASEKLSSLSAACTGLGGGARPCCVSTLVVGSALLVESTDHHDGISILDFAHATKMCIFNRRLRLPGREGEALEDCVGEVVVELSFLESFGEFPMVEYGRGGKRRVIVSVKTAARDDDL